MPDGTLIHSQPENIQKFSWAYAARCAILSLVRGTKGSSDRREHEMKFRDSKTGAMVRNAYSVIKYCGGVNCGSAIDFATLDQCMEFANDGFCDYCRITCDDGSVLKIHFTTPEQETMEPAWHEY